MPAAMLGSADSTVLERLGDDLDAFADLVIEVSITISHELASKSGKRCKLIINFVNSI